MSRIIPKRTGALTFFILLAVFLTGCSLGPKALQGNRLDYNVSVQRSNNEELLLNLVRARYAEPLFFLQVGSISSSFSYSASVGASATFYHNHRHNVPIADFYTPSLGAGMSEAPTITYTPLQGEKAVKQLQSEMRLDRFLILTRIGWSIESLMWLSVVQIGELRNFSVDITTGEGIEPSYHKFLELAHMLGEMQSRGDIEFVSLCRGETGADCLRLQLRYLDQREAEKLEGLLGIKAERIALPGGRFVSTMELTTVRDFTPYEREKDKCTRIPVKLKSFFEMLLDLALYVEVPADEEMKRIARPFKSLPKDILSRGGLHAGLIRIKSRWDQPGDAFAAVPYRNRWFYIADDDLRSKAYMMLVGSIYSLQSGDLPTVTPLLTLPVGR